MNTFLWIFLTVLVVTWSCCNSCNSCCTSCCSNCQQQCTTNRCLETCQSNCCSQNCQQCTNNNCEQQIISKKTDSQDDASKEEKYVEKKDTSQQSNSQSGFLKANVSSSNIITNNNVINLTIGVNSNVVNNINLKKGERDDGTTVTKVVPVPVKVPVCGPKCNNSSPSTTTPPPLPPVPPPRPGCCVIIRPCVTQDCNHYEHRCDNCHGPYGYLPINPCHHGCYKRPTWERHCCTMGHCVSRSVDCSYCKENFYITYSEYSRCYGCFYGQ